MEPCNCIRTTMVSHASVSSPRSQSGPRQMPRRFWSMMMIDFIAIHSLSIPFQLIHCRTDSFQHGRNDNQRFLPLQRHPLHCQGPGQGRRPVPLQQLQELQRLNLRAQLPYDEDDNRISERERFGAVVSRRCHEVGKGVGALLLLEMCTFDG